MPHVLIVDDDAFIRDLIADILGLEGYTVRAAVDGLAGVREYTALRPDCVVLDVMMPGINGFEVLRQMRCVDDLPVPVIMLTAAGEPESEREAWVGGADFFLQKPFEAEQLVEVMESLLSDSPLRPSL
ncbi:MAG: transcriptional regulator [Frankiales bacterium]|nr:transcriptional regulator [Frankiales bacterium]